MALAELVARYLVIGDRPVAGRCRDAIGARLRRPDHERVRTLRPGPPDQPAADRRHRAGHRRKRADTAAGDRGRAGLSPVRFVQEIRLDQAVFLLRTTSQTVQAIATSVGYRNAATLRTLVRRRRGTTLAAVRGDRTGLVSPGQAAAS